jgi:hypothetical protein
MPLVMILERSKIKLKVNKMETKPMTSQGKHTASSKQNSSPCNNGVYEIKIKGHLDDHWKPWFEGMVLKYEMNAGQEQEYTLMTGPVADQPALHGLLAKIRDLNLILISIRKICPEPEKENHEQNSLKKR